MDSAEHLTRSLFSVQEKKRRYVANKLDVLMPICYWLGFSTWASGQLQTLPLVIILVVHPCGAQWEAVEDHSLGRHHPAMQLK